jgi:1-acyl-sn-glycerol-3-phosphate acyltransferase
VTALSTPRAAQGPDPRGPARARRLGRLTLRPLWRISAYGAEHVPADGAVILAGNHTGFLDGPMIVTFSPRPVHFMVKQELLRGPLAPALRKLGQIGVDRSGTDRAAILASLGVLEQGGILGLFPEGRRSAEDFATMHNGLAYFALRSGAPVVPVACLGSGESGRTAKTMPRIGSRLHVVFGPPIELDTAAGRSAGRSAVLATSERLRAELVAHLAGARALVADDRPRTDTPDDELRTTGR